MHLELTDLGDRDACMGCHAAALDDVELEHARGVIGVEVGGGGQQLLYVSWV